MNTYDQNTTTGNVYDTATFCVYRLPCGYCSYMSRPCPVQGNAFTPTWKLNEVTCQAKETT